MTGVPLPQPPLTPSIAADARSASPPFHLSVAWANCWADAYASGTTQRIGFGGAYLPMRLIKKRLGPWRYRQLASATNNQTCYFDIHGEPRDGDVEGLFTALLATAASEVQIDWLPRESPLLSAVLRRRHSRLSIVEEYASSPVVDCRGSFENYLAQSGTSVRKYWKACRRHVLDGPLSLEFIVGTDGLDGHLDEIFALEASGWKGANGSAILARADDSSFYRGLAHAAAAVGALRIAVLRDGSTLIAFEYGIVSDGILLAMKVGYDERRAKIQPGHMLALLNIRSLFEISSIAWYDMLSNSKAVRSYKRSFLTDLWPVKRLYVYPFSIVGATLFCYRYSIYFLKNMNNRYANIVFPIFGERL